MVKNCQATAVPRILLVEDDAIFQLLGRDFLKRLGCSYNVTKKGKIALKTFDQYDLIILDIGLPDINGMEVCEIIRAKNKNLPIIALTATVTDEILDSCKKVGFSDFFLKPIDAFTLGVIIKKYLPSYYAVCN
jgi:CheY-like chemotaxis protein